MYNIFSMVWLWNVCLKQNAKETPCSGPVRLTREMRGIDRRVQCVCATCGEGGLSRSEQLVGYFWLSPDWRCVLRQPAASQAKSIYFGSRRHVTQPRRC